MSPKVREGSGPKDLEPPSLGRLEVLPREILTDHIVPKIIEAGPSTVDAFLQVSRGTYQATAYSAISIARRALHRVEKQNLLLGGAGVYVKPSYSQATVEGARRVVKRIEIRSPLEHALGDLKRGRFTQALSNLWELYEADSKQANFCALFQQACARGEPSINRKHLEFLDKSGPHTMQINLHRLELAGKFGDPEMSLRVGKILVQQKAEPRLLLDVVSQLPISTDPNVAKDQVVFLYQCLHHAVEAPVSISDGRGQSYLRAACCVTLKKKYAHSDLNAHSDMIAFYLSHLRGPDWRRNTKEKKYERGLLGAILFSMSNNFYEILNLQDVIKIKSGLLELDRYENESWDYFQVVLKVSNDPKVVSYCIDWLLPLCKRGWELTASQQVIIIVKAHALGYDSRIIGDMLRGGCLVSEEYIHPSHMLSVLELAKESQLVLEGLHVLETHLLVKETVFNADVLNDYLDATDRLSRCKSLTLEEESESEAMIGYLYYKIFLRTEILPGTYPKNIERLVTAQANDIMESYELFEIGDSVESASSVAFRNFIPPQNEQERRMWRSLRVSEDEEDDMPEAYHLFFNQEG